MRRPDALAAGDYSGGSELVVNAVEDLDLATVTVIVVKDDIGLGTDLHLVVKSLARVDDWTDKPKEQVAERSEADRLKLGSFLLRPSVFEFEDHVALGDVGRANSPQRLCPPGPWAISCGGTGSRPGPLAWPGQPPRPP